MINQSLQIIPQLSTTDTTHTAKIHGDATAGLDVLAAGSRSHAAALLTIASGVELPIDGLHVRDGGREVPFHAHGRAEALETLAAGIGQGRVLTVARAFAGWVDAFGRRVVGGGHVLLALITQPAFPRIHHGRCLPVQVIPAGLPFPLCKVHEVGADVVVADERANFIADGLNVFVDVVGCGGEVVFHGGEVVGPFGVEVGVFVAVGHAVEDGFFEKVDTFGDAAEVGENS